MNERIKELMIQTDNHFGWCLASEDLVWCEKFAELIIRECLSKIENEASQYAEPVWAFELVNDIKDHFGVEEPEDSACPLCGEDGGTTCGMPGCQY